MTKIMVTNYKTIYVGYISVKDLIIELKEHPDDAMVSCEQNLDVSYTALETDDQEEARIKREWTVKQREVALLRQLQEKYGKDV